MSKSYDPRDWYWLAQDGRLFASARVVVVTVDDLEYRDWLANGGPGATTWPRDETGTQTVAALQEVLAPYGLHADLSAYAAAKRYAVETGGIVLNGARISTSGGSQAKIGNAYALMQASGTASVEFKTQDGFVTLTADQFKVLAIAVGGHVQACYAKEAEVDAGISAGTIKTLAEVDAAFVSLNA